MSWLDEKKKLEKEKANAHFLFIDSLNKVQQTEETIKHLQRILPELKEISKKYKSKRDRLDQEWKEKFADDSLNVQKQELSRLLERAGNLQKQINLAVRKS